MGPWTRRYTRRDFGKKFRNHNKKRERAMIATTKTMRTRCVY